MLTPEDLELRWPVDLLAYEVDALVADLTVHSWTQRAQLLLAEAFVGEEVVRGLHEAEDRFRAGSRDRMAPGFDLQVQARYLGMLVQHVKATSPPSAPRPFFAERGGARLSEEPSQAQRHSQLRAEWVDLVGWFEARGYLEQIRNRYERPEGGREDLVSALDYEALRLLGVPRLWPLRPQEWTEDLFYSLVELVHDLAARPRFVFQHEEMQEPVYEAFSRPAGQRLYRWRVNQMFAKAANGLALAEDGPDTGRVVQNPAPDFAELEAETAASTEHRTEVGHARALFRLRGATREEKKSAVVELAGVCERHRHGILKSGLPGGDSGELFNIANNFHLRHKDLKQIDSYGEEYLDWLYWWYLATVALLERLLAQTNHDG